MTETTGYQAKTQQDSALTDEAAPQNKYKSIIHPDVLEIALTWTSTWGTEAKKKKIRS